MKIIRIILVLAIFIGLQGCASEPPKMSGGRDTPYYISSNVPGAQLLTVKGNIVGKTPVEGTITWKGIDSPYSPYGEMIEVHKSTERWLLGVLNHRDYYFVGKIVAPGYKSKVINEKIGWYREYSDGPQSYLEDKIIINAYLEPEVRSVGAQPQQQQQQQQQQQTIVIPGKGDSTTNDCISECKKMFLKGELKSPIEECYKLLCE